MKSTFVALIILCAPFPVFAGCIGPIIMGECKGQSVPFDTHPQGPSQTPPPGFYYDKRGTSEERKNPGAINPFTGRDANDADMRIR